MIFVDHFCITVDLFPHSMRVRILVKIIRYLLLSWSLEKRGEKEVKS